MLLYYELRVTFIANSFGGKLGRNLHPVGDLAFQLAKLAVGRIVKRERA